MFFILLFLLIVFFFPFLLMPFFFFILLMILFIPYKFTLDALITLFTAPSQLFKIATNPALRRNHALEHATINVIEERYGQQPLSGLAREEGFYIQGLAHPQLIREAAEEGLYRLMRGEKELVVHRRCGTSLTVANLLTAIVLIFLIWQTGNLNIFLVIFAILVSNITSPWVGRWVQKRITTSADVSGMYIQGVYSENPGAFFGFSRDNRYFVRTGYIRNSGRITR